MRLPQVAGVIALCAAVVVITDVMMQSSLLRLMRPRITSPADGEIVTGSVNVSWEGPQPMQATLTGSGQRVDLGVRESPFEIDPSRFPRPGQYGIELRATRMAGLIGADRRFMIRRARERGAAAGDAIGDEPATGETAPPPSAPETAQEHLAAERDQLRADVEQLQALVARLREDNADLGQALDELQAESDGRLAAADQQRDELVREHLLALQENQFLRLRLANIPACTVWGYMAIPNPATNPSGRAVLVSDRAGSVFRAEAECARGRRADPTGISPCVCVGAVWSGGP